MPETTEKVLSQTPPPAESKVESAPVEAAASVDAGSQDSYGKDDLQGQAALDAVANLQTAAEKSIAASKANPSLIDNIQETNPEVEGAKETSIDDFNALKGSVPFLKESQEKKEGEVKVQPAKVAEVKATPEVKPEATKQDGTKVVARDYSGFEPNEQELLKKMSNDAFNYVKPQLLEKKALAKVIAAKDQEIANLKVGKQLLPDSYYEHEHAYVLTPDYNAATRDLNLASFVENHWKEQLINIRQGSPWKALTDIKDGRPIYSDPQKADAKAEGDVLSLINASAMQKMQFQGRVNEVQNSFKQRHQQAVAAIKQAEKDNFSAYEDEKHPYQPVIKSILDSMPPEFKNNPLTPLVAKSGAATVQALNMVKDLMKSNADLKKENEELKKKAPADTRKTPTEGDIQAGAGTRLNGSEKEITIDSFRALRN